MRFQARRRTRSLALAAALAVALGCSAGEETELSPLAQQGRDVYQNVCVACHNGDPNLDGAIGPANAGASRELLEAKVLHGTYPPGYTPKRPDSHAMPPLPYLKDQIPALAAYLAEVKN
jgi:mono/diheme cytochrome c family protein